MKTLLDVDTFSRPSNKAQMDELIGFFRKNGFVVIRGLLDHSTVSSVFDFLDESVNHGQRYLLDKGIIDSELTFQEAILDFFQSGCVADLEHQAGLILNGHFPLDVRLSPKLKEIPNSISLQNVIRGISGSEELFVHMPPAARFVLPGQNSAGVPAHQDVSYGSHMSDFLTCWVPLTTIDENRGGVIVFEGSTVEKQIPVDQEDNGWLSALPESDYVAVHCQPMSPGDVLFLNKWILHKSATNESENPRISIDYRFFSSKDRSTKPHLCLRRDEVIFPEGQQIEETA